MRSPAGRPVRPLRLTANLFGLAFGLCGLAQCWSVANLLAGVPAWPADILWVLAGLAWVITLIGYASNVIATGRLRTELSDPIFAPFTSLIVMVPMLLGVALATIQPAAGEVVFLAGLILTVLLVLGSILLLRLFTQPPLPTPLLPTMAIELAPPVVAGSAWFAINGNRPDSIALLLAGYAIIMLMVQFRLIPVYRRVPFGPGSWAYAFSFAAVFTVAIRWLAAEHVGQQLALTNALLTLITLGIGVLGIATVRGLVRGSYLPRAQARPAAGSASTATGTTRRPG